MSLTPCLWIDVTSADFERGTRCDFTLSPHGATVNARLWINRFMVCSGQQANATSQPTNLEPREQERRAVWYGELVRAKHRTHQSNAVVIRSAEQRVTYVVRQHASQRASKIVVGHDPAARGAAGRSKCQHALG